MAQLLVILFELKPLIKLSFRCIMQSSNNENIKEHFQLRSFHYVKYHSG